METDFASPDAYLDGVKSVDASFEVVRESNGGRPLYMTARRFLTICHGIEKGQNASEACRSQLVGYKNFRKHVQRNSKYQRRLKEAEETRFNIRREQAEASVMAAGEKSWMAHAWWLERCLPEKYALRQVNRNLNSTDVVVGDGVSQDDLDRMTQQIAAFEQKRRTRPMQALQAPVQTIENTPEQGQ
jgi:hypothetical protein